MANESNSQYDIKIATEYDGTGAQAAQADLAATGAAATDAGAGVGTMAAATEQVAKGAEQGLPSLRHVAHAIHGVETAAEGGHMSLIRWAMSLKSLYGLLIANPLTAFATAIGAVAIAIGVWIHKMSEAREAIHEDLKKLEEENAATAKKIAADMEQARFEGLKGEIDEIIKRYDAMNTKAREQLAYMRAMEDAARKVKLAEMDAAEAKEIKGAKGDPVAEAQIHGKYAKQRLGAKQQNETDTAQREYDAAVAEKERRVEEQRELEAKQAALDGVTPARAAYEENRRASGRDAKEAGVKSDERHEIEKGEKLREEVEAMLKKHTAVPEKDMLALLKFTSQEEELRKRAKDSPTFANKKELDKAESLEARIPFLEQKMGEVAKLLAERPYLAKNEGFAAEKKGIEEEMEQAQAAKRFRASQGLLKDQAKAAKTSEENNAKLKDETAKKLAAEKDAAEKAQMAVDVTGMKWKATAAKQLVDAQQAADAAAKAEREAAAREAAKDRQAELENAQAAKSLATNPAEMIAAIQRIVKAELANNVLGENASGADKEAWSAKNAKISAQGQKEIEQIQNKARNPAQEEADRHITELAGDGKSKGELQHLSDGRMLMGANKLNAAAQYMAEHHTESAVKAVADALEEVAKMMGTMSNKDKAEMERMKRELEQVKNQVRGHSA